ncbi:hypothetical protein Vretimale_7226 [Volvox reticuliferus]|uniref:Uncharacterized protein n=1 Tax=Volvox reticuliferus TaxID=1737510 RepID=A0A8J4CG20_9CHLO|nr:hypothetical protein Vretifemale_11162 [Volvox reticuliferus]GIM02346.1 hypothetical protein Vretimale_7226 [Volvox reticuliferus]
MKVEDPIKAAFKKHLRNKRRHGKTTPSQPVQIQPPKPVHEPVPTGEAVEAPDVAIDIGQGSDFEYLGPLNEDVDNRDAGSDAYDDFSAADDEPEPEPGPELSLTHTVRKGYLCHVAASGDSRSHLLCSTARVLQQLAESRAVVCPQCASPSPEGGRICPVTLITWNQPICVDVPVCWCPPCGAPHNVRPTELDCLPDSKTGWDLHLRRDGQHVLWWHQPLLQMFDLVSYKSKHLSADAFCSALLDNWEQNGISHPASVYATTLRQRLRQAFLLFMDCQGLVEDYPEGALSDWPRGALNGCPCCGDARTCSRAAVTGDGVATAVQAPSDGAEGPGDANVAATAAGLDPGGEFAGVAAESHDGGNPSGLTVAVQAPSDGAGGPGDADSASAAGGLEPGGERAAVEDRHSGASGRVPSANTEGPEMATVSSGTAAIGIAALAAEWLLRDICGPEAAGPGPSTLHSVHFDACVLQAKLAGPQGLLLQLHTAWMASLLFT